MKDCYKDALPHPDARALSNYEVIGILQKKLELCRRTLSEREYRTLPHIRHMEATLKYAHIAHRNSSYRTRESIDAKRKILEEISLRLVERGVYDQKVVKRNLTGSEIVAMLNLEPSSVSEMNILFPWMAKYEPLDVEDLLTQFTVGGS